MEKLAVRRIQADEFEEMARIFKSELKGTGRILSNKYLLEKFKKFPEFFIGVFLNGKMIGAVCGSLRKILRRNFLVINELAVKSKFHGKGFGKKLVKAFEAAAESKYCEIRVGSVDKVVGFYSSLGYKPFLLIQYKKGAYSIGDFKDLKIIESYEYKEYKTFEVKQDKPDMKLLEKLRKRYPKAYFQYIFTKKL